MLKLEIIMRQQNKTQTDVANASRINRVTINRIVRGWERPSADRAKAIADALEWDADRAAELFEEVTEVR